MFFRLHTDGRRESFDLRGLFGAAHSNTCWILGGGPSLAEMPIDEIRHSPCPKFAINLAGAGLIRPNFWTSYDPTVRFHRSIYLDASIIKFVNSCRATDLVPETTLKVCDCPATLFFERDREVGFHNFLNAKPSTVIDWQDSLIQTIHLAYLLGFRRLLLAGCEMYVRPSEEWRRSSERLQVTYRERELLGDFVKRCQAAGQEPEDIASFNTSGHYHFDEVKPLNATIQTDFHYFRVAQYLRLSRRALASAGMQLFSVTPNSRLNDDFPYLDALGETRSLLQQMGDPRLEKTRGLYSDQVDRKPSGIGPMRDFRPHFWQSKSDEQRLPERESRRKERVNFPQLPEVCVEICENP